MRIDGFARGADWNPDQWPESVWRRDLELMVEAGVNLVTLPVFAWASLEPSPGRFDFGWLDRIIDATHESGIGVDLATGTATPPAWLVREHPEVLPVDQSGNRLEYGSRQSYCLNSTAFIDGTKRLTAAMVDRYHNHPALAMWHISNEYGDHITRCYCDNCGAAFRAWLEAKYLDIANLNDAWGTQMWGQGYTKFAHIEPPRKTMAPANPTQTLDFARFSTDSINRLFQAEHEVIRAIDSEHPITTNFMGLMTDVDYWSLGPKQDVVSFDSYPDPADPLGHLPAALNYGVMRGVGGRKPWMLLESAPAAVSWREVNPPKAPGVNRRNSFQAVAHGSDAVMYFQWRASRVGAERFHSAIVGHYGEDSRTLAETSTIWHELDKLSEIVGSQVRSSVALVVDWESRWAMYGPETMPSDRLQWYQQVRSYHQMLTSLGLTVDVVHPGSDFSQYAVVVAPSQFMLDEFESEKWRQFVAAGGKLIVGPFSAVVDRSNHVHEGGAPGVLASVLGIRVEEPWPIADGETVALSGESAIDKPVSAWSEMIHATSAEAIATYASGPLTGRPAITRNELGAGSATYVSCLLDSQTLTELLGDEIGLHEARQGDVDVEIVTRTDGANDYTFAINHGTRPRRVHPLVAVEVLLGSTDEELPVNGVLILKSPASVKSLAQVRILEVQ